MDNELKKHLSKKDLMDLLDLSQKSLTCRSQQNVTSLFGDLERLFYFEHALTAKGNLLHFLEMNSNEPCFDILNISYPTEYLQEYFTKQLYYNDIPLCAFLNTMSPVRWFDTFKKQGYDYPCIQLSFDYNINDGWVYGSIDRTSLDGNVFYFSGPFVDSGQRVKSILTYIIPFLSEANKRVGDKEQRHGPHLTKRETEILNWIKDGKTSWEISQILGCSKRNIDFHTNNIKIKLNAMNRAQAVAIAIHNGIISF